KIVTVTGEGIKNPQNVHVKIGTNLKEVIQAIGGYAADLGDAYFIAGGPMTGKAVAFDNLIVSRALTSVVVMPKDIREVNPECMGCGKCGEVCPVFLSPIIIKETLEDNDNARLAKLRPQLCVECGLCSYICPSRIELTDAVVRAKNTVMAKR
ncbi:MAG TPA: SLBB domain-containing protein, partial [Bacilli bacterium]